MYTLRRFNARAIAISVAAILWLNIILQQWRTALEFMLHHHLMSWGYVNPLFPVIAIGCIVYFFWTVVEVLPVIFNYSDQPTREETASDYIRLIAMFPAFGMGLSLFCHFTW